MDAVASTRRLDKAATGISGLDDVLAGGFHRHRVYLLEGNPGTGKTTLAMQFLLEGRAMGERGLYVTLSENAEELQASAASHGWSLEGIDVFELLPPESILDEAKQQTLLHSSDLELGEATRVLFEQMDRLQPDRLVVDSLSEIRLLAQSSLRYRRQLLAMKHYFSRHGATVLLLDDLTSEAQDKTVHSLAHGVVRLEELASAYGAERRRLRVTKYRGQRFRGGFHDFEIRTGEVAVYPRLIAAEHRRPFGREVLTSGIAELDLLFGGGLERGTSVLVLGPAGSGKTLLTLGFVVTAIARGERAALFAFDEDIGLLVARGASMGLDLQALVESGRLILEQVDAAELSPGQFAHKVRDCVESHEVRTVLIDSLNGYQAAMPEEQFIILHMHELLTYLNRRGILTFLTVAQHGLFGSMRTPVDLTYLADTVVLLRFFEALGRVRRALSVLKKRSGAHEDTIREMRITPNGIQVGPPLANFQGVMTGVPEYLGRNDPVPGDRDA